MVENILPLIHAIDKICALSPGRVIVLLYLKWKNSIIRMTLKSATPCDHWSYKVLSRIDRYGKIAIIKPNWQVR